MINKVLLIGNLGRDPEVRKFDNGSTVAKFSLATNENYRDKTGEWQTITEWHNIVVWGPLAERVERDLTKGNMVFIEGKLTTRKWQDQDGNDKYTTEVRAIVLRKLDRRENAGGSNYMPSEKDEFPPVDAPKSSSPVVSEPNNAEDDLPF